MINMCDFIIPFTKRVLLLDLELGLPCSGLSWCLPMAAARGSEGAGSPLRWNVDGDLASRLTESNTREAEPWGSWASTTSFLAELDEEDPAGPTTFYDTLSSVALFVVSVGQRAAFLEESSEHGWPSFRSKHVIDPILLVERDGYEVTSSTGTHLGHVNTDDNGPRYCINLASVAGWSNEDRERLVVVGKRGATARSRPSTASPIVGVLAKDEEVTALGSVRFGKKRRLFVVGSVHQGWITDAPTLVRSLDDSDGLVSTCGFVRRADGKPVSNVYLIREFERSTKLRAPDAAAWDWSVQEINLFFMSSGTILPARNGVA